MTRMEPESPGAARLPAASLASLADLRRDLGIGVIADGDHAWIRWEAGDESLSLRLMAIPGAELFVLRDGLWYPAAGRLPRFGLPLDSARPIPMRAGVVSVALVVNSEASLIRSSRGRRPWAWRATISHGPPQP